MIFSRFKWNQSTILELDRPQSAFIYYAHQRLNLLSGLVESHPIEVFLKNLDLISLQERVDQPIVYHFFYEYGFLCQGLGHLLKDDVPLVIEIKYQVAKKNIPRRPKVPGFHLRISKRPVWANYKKTFQNIQQELLEGNCYQVNLTCPYDFVTDHFVDASDMSDYFFAQKNLGAYAHATNLGEKMILSNSPECLFQYKENEIFTMPIKGTLPLENKNWKAQWKKMLRDPKEEGELIMITDLLKNDLNKLENPRAEVLKLRSPLLVPGLLHQYSLIGLRLNNDVSLAATIKALFPGGSITGAPKKRVMEIIACQEYFQRGIYCGSTLLCIDDKKVASINIRTAMVDLEKRIWRYGAGGGITLLSKAEDEFLEMESKVGSFLEIFKAKGKRP